MLREMRQRSKEKARGLRRASTRGSPHLLQRVLERRFERSRSLMPADRLVQRLHASNEVRDMLPWIRSACLSTKMCAASERTMRIDRAPTIRTQQRTSILRMRHQLLPSARSHTLSCQESLNPRHHGRLARHAKVAARRPHLTLARQRTLLHLRVNRTQGIELRTEGIGFGHGGQEL